MSRVYEVQRLRGRRHEDDLPTWQAVSVDGYAKHTFDSVYPAVELRDNMARLYREERYRVVEIIQV